MLIEMNRTGKKLILEKTRETKDTPYDIDVAEAYGYRKIDALDFENCLDVQWDGIEFNRLVVKDDVIYRFNEWVGKYPHYDGIEIEEIGKCLHRKD